MSSKPGFHLHDGSTRLTPIDGCYQLQEYTTYLVELHEGVDPGHLTGLDSRIFTLLRPGLGQLRFENYVGRARLLDTLLEVKSRKLDEAAFGEMLSDICASVASLPFSFATPTSFDFTPDPDAPPVLYHQWLMLRGWFRGDGVPSLEEDIATVLHDPHRRMDREPVVLDPSRVAHLDARTLEALVSRPDDWARVGPASPFAETSLARRTQALCDERLFPPRVHTRRTVTSVDTPENRFVRYLLEASRELNRVFRDQMASRASCLTVALVEETVAIEELLSRLLAAPLFNEVTRMTMLPANSMVLQRREGYRTSYQAYLRMLGGLDWAIEANQLKSLLEAKKISDLYELWTFFKVVDTVRAEIGEPETARVFATSELAVSVPRAVEVAWPSERVVVSYNKSMCPGSDTYSLTMRPDVIMDAPGGRTIFDAKFKVSDELSYQEEDILTMHAYREAIAGVRAAYVLYPGEKTHFFACGSPMEGVGAIALRPGAHGLPARLAEAVRSSVTPLSALC